MTGTATPSLAAAREVCGRRVERVLPGGMSVLCRGLVGEGWVVMKPVPRGCLYVPPGSADGALELHPHVRDRLQRVRELADARVAGLCGVEEDAALGPMAVWRYVEGTELSGLQGVALPGGGVMEVALAVVEAVEGLHLLGIVHGRLHPRNVIVRPMAAGKGCEVVLTHVSPLFVDDPAVDWGDLVTLLRGLNARHRAGEGVDAGEVERQHAALAWALSGGGSVEVMPVDRLRERLLRAGSGGGEVAGVRMGVREAGVGGAWWTAVACAAAGLTVSAAALWAARPAWLEAMLGWGARLMGWGDEGGEW